VRGNGFPKINIKENYHEFYVGTTKISLHGAGAIGDMVKLVAGKQWGKALIVTDGQLVKLGLLDSLFSALDEQQMAYQLFDEVFPNPTEALVQQGYAAYRGPLRLPDRLRRRQPD
jgi:alcohol dehydrogenase